MHPFSLIQIKAVLIGTAAAIGVLTSAGSALAFNPQPDPPARYAPIQINPPSFQLPGH